ncbi:hypothetical protein WOLCODRAFT_113208 [Wolfiporia cocos MD-104 SS10]|uniref:USP domain-containing protein n=1 Tax=Wolfiporia cocos (strain MD-104) TaxID=742152 RepID=A0A2H3IXF6_WOLCO|nr:hypothetical protein WOLCODRAFT_113208 [Wolfiporia cocos MD-104 SS10]
MMGDVVTAQVALKVLRKHNGDVGKAASALLEGDIDAAMPSFEVAQPSASGSGPRTPPPSKPENPPVIDLTADEDTELSRALQASLEDQGPAYTPTFGPSNRAPDPNWAVVPSNATSLQVPAGVSLSQDDQSLSRAIEASLTYDYNDVFEDLPLTERVRKDGRPVALRPTQPSFAYAGLLLHCLFYVPQVRNLIAQWFSDAGSDVENQPIPLLLKGPRHLIWSLLEIFVNMDLALLSELNVDAAIAAFDPGRWSTPVELPGDVVYAFYDNLTWTIENILHEDLPPPVPRLFHFRPGFFGAEPAPPRLDRRADMSLVRVDVRPERNDLLACLADELGLHGGGGADAARVIVESSDVVAFQLRRDAAPPSYGAAAGARTERTTFGYPPSVFLDQFMQENFEIAGARRERQRELRKIVKDLKAKRKSLTRHKDRDTLADLRSSLHYYENVAEHNDDPQRKAMLHETAQKLRKILTRIENELQTIDATIEKLNADSANVFECPELQQHRYDLRVVLVHDGLFGRNHIYSYVKDRDTWWKTMDYSVTEARLIVSEDTALNDPVGLHLGAGPFFLIYSRALPKLEESARPPWPGSLKDSVKYNNSMFMEQLPPEIAAQIAHLQSPPSSPERPTTPSDTMSFDSHTMSSGTAEPPLSRDEPMDTAD